MSETESTEETEANQGEDSPENVLEALMQEETDALTEPSATADPFASNPFHEDPFAAGPPKAATAPADDDQDDDDQDDDAAVVEHLLAEFADQEPTPSEFRESATDPDDLDSRASEAARSLVDAEDQAALEREATALLARATTTDDAAAKQARRQKKQRQDRILVGLLMANLALMGLMLAVPGTDEPKPGDQPPPIAKGEAGQQPTKDFKDPANKAPDPFHAPLQEPDEILPNSELYEAAQMQVAKGDYARAFELFERYLKAHPELQSFQLQLVYSSMAYCLNSLGRRADALAYGAKIDNLRQITALPDDLWEAAHQAERDGRGIDMRRYYARFLLQQDQLGKRWATQGKIAEAYMKIGDSYRIDAEKGSQVEALRDKIERNLKEPTGKQKPAEKAADDGHGKKGGGH